MKDKESGRLQCVQAPAPEGQARHSGADRAHGRDDAPETVCRILGGGGERGVDRVTDSERVSAVRELIDYTTSIAAYRGTSLIRKRHPGGPYSRTMPKILWWSWGVGNFS